MPMYVLPNCLWYITYYGIGHTIVNYLDLRYKSWHVGALGILCKISLALCFHIGVGAGPAGPVLARPLFWRFNNSL